jgi:ubiquinone/menaquinone biosynthesis C-methylase UbiE
MRPATEESGRFPRAVIKFDLEALLASGEPVVLELGCGTATHPGRVGIDRLDMPGVDIVADLNERLAFLPDSSVDAIHSRSLFEHLTEFDSLMREIVRVLKPGGRCHVFVPHFSNPYYYSDPTHVRFFGLYTFYYYVPKERQLRRTVPTFYSDTKIEIHRVRLKFSSPFRVVRFFRKLVTALVNSSSFFQEWYEGSFTGIVPCYGIDIEFGPIK